MNKEENIITEFVQHSTGFTISKCDLTTGKVVINTVEITSVEDWNKVTKSLVELQQKVNQLETNRDEVIELLSKGVTFCENDSQGNYDICNIAINREKKAIEILERGKDETK